jgi:hypothetical protein
MATTMVPLHYPVRFPVYVHSALPIIILFIIIYHRIYTQSSPCIIHGVSSEWSRSRTHDFELRVTGAVMCLSTPL